MHHEVRLAGLGQVEALTRHVHGATEHEAQGLWLALGLDLGEALGGRKRTQALQLFAVHFEGLEVPSGRVLPAEEAELGSFDGLEQSRHVDVALLGLHVALHEFDVPHQRSAAPVGALGLLVHHAVHELTGCLEALLERPLAFGRALDRVGDLGVVPFTPGQVQADHAVGRKQALERGEEALQVLDFRGNARNLDHVEATLRLLDGRLDPVRSGEVDQLELDVLGVRRGQGVLQELRVEADGDRLGAGGLNLFTRLAEIRSARGQHHRRLLDVQPYGRRLGIGEQADTPNRREERRAIRDEPNRIVLRQDLRVRRILPVHEPRVEHGVFVRDDDLVVLDGDLYLLVLSEGLDDLIHGLDGDDDAPLALRQAFGGESHQRQASAVRGHHTQPLGREVHVHALEEVAILLAGRGEPRSQDHLPKHGRVESEEALP